MGGKGGGGETPQEAAALLQGSDGGGSDPERRRWWAAGGICVYFESLADQIVGAPRGTTGMRKAPAQHLECGRCLAKVRGYSLSLDQLCSPSGRMRNVGLGVHPRALSFIQAFHLTSFPCQARGIGKRRQCVGVGASGKRDREKVEREVEVTATRGALFPRLKQRGSCQGSPQRNLVGERILELA